MTSIFVDQPSIHYLVGHILVIRGLGSLVKRLYYLEVTLNKSFIILLVKYFLLSFEDYVFIFETIIEYPEENNYLRVTLLCQNVYLFNKFNRNHVNFAKMRVTSIGQNTVDKIIKLNL